MTDLQRLENDVAIRENHRKTPSLDIFNRGERIGEKTLGERIVDEKIRHTKQLLGVRMFGSISLQSAEVIRIAQFGSQLLENLPIFLRSIRANSAREMTLQICCDSVVIQQCVVYVEQEDDATRRIFAFINYLVTGHVPTLIAQMSRVCHAKMQWHAIVCCSAFFAISATAAVKSS